MDAVEVVDYGQRPKTQRSDDTMTELVSPFQRAASKSQPESTDGQMQASLGSHQLSLNSFALSTELAAAPAADSIGIASVPASSNASTKVLPGLEEEDFLEGIRKTLESRGLPEPSGKPAMPETVLEQSSPAPYPLLVSGDPSGFGEIKEEPGSLPVDTWRPDNTLQVEEGRTAPSFTDREAVVQQPSGPSRTDTASVDLQELARALGPDGWQKGSPAKLPESDMEFPQDVTAALRAPENPFRSLRSPSTGFEEVEALAAGGYRASDDQLGRPPALPRNTAVDWGGLSPDSGSEGILGRQNDAPLLLEGSSGADAGLQSSAVQRVGGVDMESTMARAGTLQAAEEPRQGGLVAVHCVPHHASDRAHAGNLALRRVRQRADESTQAGLLAVLDVLHAPGLDPAEDLRALQFDRSLALGLAGITLIMVAFGEPISGVGTRFGDWVATRTWQAGAVACFGLALLPWALGLARACWGALQTVAELDLLAEAGKPTLGGLLSMPDLVSCMITRQAVMIQETRAQLQNTAAMRERMDWVPTKRAVAGSDASPRASKKAIRRKLLHSVLRHKLVLAFGAAAVGAVVLSQTSGGSGGESRRGSRASAVSARGRGWHAVEVLPEQAPDTLIVEDGMLLSADGHPSETRHVPWVRTIPQ
eukprot:jgi/Botrbrau1/5187/Bobra.0172s0057.1